MKAARQTERLTFLNVVACLDALADAPPESGAAEVIRRRLRDAKRTWAAALHDVDVERKRSCGGVESRHAVEAGKARDQRTATGAPGLVGGAVPLDRVSAVGRMRSDVTVPTAGVAPGPHDTHPRRPDAGIPL